MEAKIRIVSDGHPDNTKITWIPTGETIPVKCLTYTIGFDSVGIATLEIPAEIELDVKAIGVLQKINNDFEMKNPWLRPAPDDWPVDEVQSVSVEDRIHELRNFSITKLRAVIAYPGTQKTVKNAAARRLKALIK